MPTEKVKVPPLTRAEAIKVLRATCAQLREARERWERVNGLQYYIGREAQLEDAMIDYEEAAKIMDELESLLST